MLLLMISSTVMSMASFPLKNRYGMWQASMMSMRNCMTKLSQYTSAPFGYPYPMFCSTLSSIFEPYIKIVDTETMIYTQSTKIIVVVIIFTLCFIDLSF